MWILDDWTDAVRRPQTTPVPHNRCRGACRTETRATRLESRAASSRRSSFRAERLLLQQLEHVGTVAAHEIAPRHRVEVRKVVLPAVGRRGCEQPVKAPPLPEAAVAGEEQPVEGSAQLRDGGRIGGSEASSRGAEGHVSRATCPEDREGHASKATRPRPRVRRVERATRPEGRGHVQRTRWRRGHAGAEVVPSPTARV